MIYAVYIPTAFGAGVGLTLLLSWWSRSHVMQKLALLLLAAWATSNVAVNLMGFDQAPMLIPSIDCAVALLVALVGFRNRSVIALAVFCLYVAVGLVHVVGFASYNQGTYTYYAILNVLFLLQLIIVGGSSARMAVRPRIYRRDKRLRLDPSRR